MGMAASQARYLSLVERMSDIEYQGQQINQMRTTLSEQANTLYNQLLNLEVPTPPSSNEFSTIIYSGSDGATDFTLGKVIPTGKTYSVDIKYQKVGHYMDSKGTVAVTGKPGRVHLSSTNIPQYNQAIKSTQGVNYYDNGNINQPLFKYGSGIGVTNGNEVLQSIDPLSSYTGPATKVYAIIDPDPDSVDDSDKIVMEFSLTDAKEYQKRDNSIKFYALITVDSTYGTSLGANDYLFSGTGTFASNLTSNSYEGGGYSQNYLQTATNLYVYNGSNAYQVTPGTISRYFTQIDDKTFILKSGFTLATVSNNSMNEYDDNSNISGVGGNVNGNAISTMTDAITNGSIASESVSEFVEALRHRFPEDCINKTDAEVIALFSVYFTQDDGSTSLTPHFMKTAELSNAFVNQDGVFPVEQFEYNAGGKYTESVTQKECTLTFDSDGRISKINIPVRDSNGNIRSYNSFDLEAKKVTDEAAYQDAMKQYEYAQYEYDKAQLEINKQTEIIQANDKKLELRLTRLDNERNALKTELDAVKKVTSDNIEKSFKTFSG